MFNYSWIAKMATSREPILKGLLPSVQTIFTLLVISLAIASGMWLWSGAAMTLAAFVPVYLKALVGIGAVSLLNFVFNRDITTAVLNAREIRAGSGMDPATSVKIRKIVDHVRCELNAMYREKYKEAHVDLPMPRLCVYTNDKATITTVLGATTSDAALFFSSTFFESQSTKWDERHIAALVAHQMVQIYQRRGWSQTIVSIMSDFLSTLKNLQGSELFHFKLIGMLAGPLQFFFFVQKSTERSTKYAAAKDVTELGLGMDYYHAIDIKVCPSMYKQRSYTYLLLDQDKKKRPRYDGLFKEWLRPLTDRIDGLEWTEDENDKKGYRIVSMIKSMIRETLYTLQELNSSDPRTTRLKDFLRELLGIGKLYNHIKPEQLEKKTVRELFEMLSQLQLIPKTDEHRFYRLAKNRHGFRELSKDELKNIWNCALSDLSEKRLEKIIKIVCEQEIQKIQNDDHAKNKRWYDLVDVKHRYSRLDPDNKPKPPVTALARRVEELERIIQQLQNEKSAQLEVRLDEANVPPIVISGPEDESPRLPSVEIERPRSPTPH